MLCGKYRVSKGTYLTIQFEPSTSTPPQDVSPTLFDWSTEWSEPEEHPLARLLLSRGATQRVLLLPPGRGCQSGKDTERQREDGGAAPQTER